MRQKHRTRTYRPTLETLEERAAPTDVTHANPGQDLEPFGRLDPLERVPFRLVTPERLTASAFNHTNEPNNGSIERTDPQPVRATEPQEQNRPAATAQGFEAPEDLFSPFRL